QIIQVVGQEIDFRCRADGLTVQKTGGVYDGEIGLSFDGRPLRMRYGGRAFGRADHVREQIVRQVQGVVNHDFVVDVKAPRGRREEAGVGYMDDIGGRVHIIGQGG